jgi:hypothetical protein
MRDRSKEREECHHLLRPNYLQMTILARIMGAFRERLIYAAQIFNNLNCQRISQYCSKKKERNMVEGYHESHGRKED